MPRSATTGVYARVSNSFSQPVFGTLIDPTDADAYFDDLDVGLNPANLAGPTNIIGALTLGKAGSAVGTLGFFNATSGSITFSPPAGALGSAVLTLPDATDTLVGKATSDALTNKTINGNIITAGGGTLTLNTNTLAVGGAGVALVIAGVNNKTLTFNNNLTLAGTDGTTMTFPTTNATLARTDAANTFTGHQTIEGVTSTGATGTGNLVFSISPTFTGTVAAAAISMTNQLTITYGSPNFTLQDSGTSFAYFQIIGSGGGTPARMRIGSEGTGGNALFTGAAANAAVFGTVDNNPVQIFTNNTLRATFNAAGGITVVGSILSNTAAGGIGYATGAGGAVTQLTSRATGVTLNTVSGAITLFSAAGVNTAGTAITFTVTNSSVAATDTINLSQKSGADKWLFFVTAVAAGSFAITGFTTAGTTTEQPVINFAVIKAVAS